MDKTKSIVERFSATQVELAKYVKIEPIEFEDRKGWVAYGEGNHFPQYLIELYNTSPVHGALVNSISFMIAGKEFTAASQVTLREIQRLKLDKLLHSTALDLKLHGGFYWEVIWSMDRSTIAQINHLPYENCRLACSDDNDDVTGVWYSRDWSDTRKKKNNPHYIPFFDINTKEENPKQVMFQHSMMVGSEYYPKPDYIGSINWIELTRQIGEYHVNNILNGFFPSLIASFNNGIPTLEEQRMIKQQLQLSIQGAENAGKVLTFFNEERDRGVEFTAFPISDSDKQYEFLSTESTNQILIAHRVTSPLLFGIRDGGGLGSNTDELKTSMYLFTKQVIEPFQRIICDGVDEILRAIAVPQGVKIAPNDLFVPEQTTEAPVTQSTEKKKVKCEHEAVSQKFESYAPTDEMATEAELGLKWREEYGRGGTEVGVARARDISNKRNLSLDTIQRMNSYFSRHEVDKQAKGWNQGEEGFPSAGRVAWQLWGGDAGRDWAKRILERVEQSTHVCQSSVDDFTDEEGKQFLKHLAECGELIDLNEWELVEECEVGDYDAEENFTKVNQALDSYADPDQKSKLDAGLYKVRYRYSTWISQNSREFCREMVRLSKGGIVWRYEDIQEMSAAGVNNQFAERGTNTINIFRYKGGVNCHHFWMRAIYKRKRESGKFLPNEGMDNEVKIAVRKAEAEGFSPLDTTVGYQDAKRPMKDFPNGGRIN
jgi:hypothetical protein